jgi:hypothetical protein
VTFARRVGLLFVAFASFLLATPASAGPKRGERVEVVTAGPEAKELEDVLRELVGYLPVKPHYARVDTVDAREVLTPPPSPAPALARVWIDLSNPQRATVFIVDGPWERVLVRHIPLKSGVDEVAREQIAHVVSAAIDALANGAEIGLTREEVKRSLFGKDEEATPPLKEEPPPPRHERRHPAPGSSAPAEDYSTRDVYDWSGPALDAPPLDLGLYYEVESWSGDALFVHGPAAALHSAFTRALSGPGIWVSAQYRFAVTVDRPPIGVRLHTGGLRALGTYDFPLAPGTRLRTGAGLGVDVVDIEPRLIEAGGNARPTQERTTFVPLARAAVALQQRLLERTNLTVAFALDVELSNARYTVDQNGSANEVFDPWTLRPAIFLGVSSYVISPPP